MTKEEKLLLIQSVDLMISTVSSQLPKVQEEEERVQGRELLGKLLDLPNKINELKESLEKK
tara:strand:- start:813 stop:995 length:183 start_codon:yes stop_codon:yes gene_type:complete